MLLNGFLGVVMLNQLKQRLKTQRHSSMTPHRASLLPDIILRLRRRTRRRVDSRCTRRRHSGAGAWRYSADSAAACVWRATCGCRAWRRALEGGSSQRAEHRAALCIRRHIHAERRHFCFCVGLKMISVLDVVRVKLPEAVSPVSVATDGVHGGTERAAGGAAELGAGGGARERGGGQQRAAARRAARGLPPRLSVAQLVESELTLSVAATALLATSECLSKSVTSALWLRANNAASSA